MLICKKNAGATPKADYTSSRICFPLDIFRRTPPARAVPMFIVPPIHVIPAHGVLTGAVD